MPFTIILQNTPHKLSANGATNKKKKKPKKVAKLFKKILLSSK